jgi:hypothetical protein
MRLDRQQAVSRRRRGTAPTLRTGDHDVAVVGVDGAMREDEEPAALVLWMEGETEQPRSPPCKTLASMSRTVRVSKSLAAGRMYPARSTMKSRLQSPA